MRQFTGFLHVPVSAVVVVMILGASMVSLSLAQPPYAYTDADLKARLPEPVLDDRPEWIQVYWKAWQIARDHIYRGTAANGFVEYWMDECFNTNIFQWDTFFMLMFGRYGFNYWPSIVSLENFYRKQHANGYICREIAESNGADFVWEGIEHTINPPVYAWAEWEHYLFTADKARFSKVVRSDRDGSQKTIFQRLIAYHDWVEVNRKRTATGLYWNTGYGSGMDNTARTGQNWIDMSAQIALDAFYLSKIAALLGEAAIAQKYQAQFENIKALINQKMWDPRDGFYYDMQDNGTLSRKKSIATAWVLLAKVADVDKAAAVKNILTNPSHFWRLCPFPTLAASEPEYVSAGGYWLGSVWSPTNYVAIRGLEAYGYDSIANLAGEKFVEHIYKVYQQTGSIWENYSADRVSPGDLSRRDFVGWGGVGPIAVMFENVIGVSVNAPEKTLSWHIHRTSRHGIKKLQFGTNEVTIICAARTSAAQMPLITVDAREEFTLNVRVAGITATRLFPAGSSSWHVEPASNVKPSQRDAARKATPVRRLTASVPGHSPNIPGTDAYTVQGKKAGAGLPSCGVVLSETYKSKGTKP